MPTITIDDIEYDEDALSTDALAQIKSMQACDVKIVVLNNDLSIVQTARNAYSIALKELLPEETPAHH